MKNSDAMKAALEKLGDHPLAADIMEEVVSEDEDEEEEEKPKVVIRSTSY
jgi:hypothetical protein